MILDWWLERVPHTMWGVFFVRQWAQSLFGLIVADDPE